jgi:hypothetical protein
MAPCGANQEAMATAWLTCAQPAALAPLESATLVTVTGYWTKMLPVLASLAAALACGGRTQSGRGEDGISDLEDPTTFERRRAASPPVYSPTDFIGEWAMTANGTYTYPDLQALFGPRDVSVIIEPGASSELRLLLEPNFRLDGCEFLADLIGAGFELRPTSCRNETDAYDPVGGDATLAADGVMDMRIRAHAQDLPLDYSWTLAANLYGSRVD